MVLLGATGCQTTKKTDERSSGRLKDDEHITTTVETGLKNEPVYKFTNVDVKTFAGVVQLSGFVNTDSQRRRAQDIAEHTEGVQQVVNSLVLKPFSPTPTSQTTTLRVYSENPGQPAPQSETSQPNQPAQPQPK